MADFSQPGTGALYATELLQWLKDRDVDALSLGYGTITNPPTGAIRYVRASNKFQEYDGAAWQDKVLSVAGGGTGGSTAATARTALGIGTLGIQDANTVAITGGTISGLGSLGVNGNAIIGGSITAGSGAVALTDATGKIPAIDSTRFASLSGANLTALNGSQITTGTVAPARLGSGSPDGTKILYGDGVWRVGSMVKTVISGFYVDYGAPVSNPQYFNLPVALTNAAKAVITNVSTAMVGLRIRIYSTTQLEVSSPDIAQYAGRFYVDIVEFQ